MTRRVARGRHFLPDYSGGQLPSPSRTTKGEGHNHYCLCQSHRCRVLWLVPGSAKALAWSRVAGADGLGPQVLLIRRFAMLGMRASALAHWKDRMISPLRLGPAGPNAEPLAMCDGFDPRRQHHAGAIHLVSMGRTR